MRPRSIILTAIIAGAALAGCGTTNRGASTSTTHAPTIGRNTSTSTSTSTSSTIALSAQTVPSSTVPRSRSGRVIASPSTGPIGTHVHIDGYGFTDVQWHTSGTNPLWLAGGYRGCDLYADAANSVAVSADGHLSGDFVVPATGDCRMTTIGDAPLVPGRYRIMYVCTVCTIGYFDVTATGPQR